jgi:hypothetical protein
MGKQPANDVAQIDAVEREIDVLRQRTEELITELERRVESRRDGARRVKLELQRLTDVRAHPRAAAGLGAGTLVAVGVGIWFLATRRAENRTLARRVRRRAVAYRALLADPERALRPRGPALSKRLLAAVLVAAATTLTKRVFAAQMR